jgi:citrate synthase
VAQAVRAVLGEWRALSRAIPGYGHPLHKDGDPRVTRLFDWKLNGLSILGRE